MFKAVIVLKNPFDTIRQLVEKKKGNYAKQGADTYPQNNRIASKYPASSNHLVDGFQSEGRLEVGLTLEGPFTKRLDDTNGIVRPNVRQREWILGYVTVNAISLQ